MQQQKDWSEKVYTSVDTILRATGPAAGIHCVAHWLLFVPLRRENQERLLQLTSLFHQTIINRPIRKNDKNI